MSDVRDRVDCSATGDTSMLFSTENGIHKEPQPPTESHNTTLHIKISRGSHASSLRPLSNKLQTEETCQFAKKKKNLPRLSLCHKQRLEPILKKSLVKLLCARDSFKQAHFSTEGHREWVCLHPHTIRPSPQAHFPKNRPKIAASNCA